MLKGVSPMKTDALTNPVIKAAIEALQNGDRKTWSALFEPDSELYDDGSPRSLKEFTRDAFGHERFTSIDRVENNGLDLTGAFHSDRWGDFSDILQVSALACGQDQPTGHWAGNLMETIWCPRRGRALSGEFLNAYAEGYFRRLLAPGSMPATWALDWRRNGDGGRHYNQVFYRMWVGVSKAGYSIKDEAPVALLVFAVPAITSILIWWRTSCAGAQCLGH